jgi:hypothetical protein
MNNNKSFKISVTEDSLTEAFDQAFHQGRTYEMYWKATDFKIYRAGVIRDAKNLLIERHHEILNNK